MLIAPKEMPKLMQNKYATKTTEIPSSSPGKQSKDAKA